MNANPRHVGLMSLVILLGLVFSAHQALAQAPGRTGGMMPDPEALIDIRIQRMTQMLGLTAEQQDAMRTLMREQIERRQAMREAMRERVSRILTEEQQAQWQQMRRGRHGMRPGRRGAGQGNPSGRFGYPPTSVPTNQPAP